MEEMKKPPLGLIPKWVHDSRRAKEGSKIGLDMSGHGKTARRSY